MTADDTLPSDLVATVRIDLLDTDPPIWREVEVPISMTLKQLHGVVQAAMEWDDAHLWSFAVGREEISQSRAAKLPLKDLLRPRKTKLLYTYDFGDCWEHQLTVAQPRPAEAGVTYPRYLAGERAAPPEDCGGVPGFYAQLDILADPHHPDHEEIKEWFGDYDPGVFDERPVRERIARIAARRSAPKKTKAR